VAYALSDEMKIIDLDDLQSQYCNRNYCSASSLATAGLLVSWSSFYENQQFLRFSLFVHRL